MDKKEKSVIEMDMSCPYCGKGVHMTHSHALKGGVSQEVKGD